MSEVTIDIPAEHVPTIREHLRISLEYAGETVAHRGGLSDAPAYIKERDFRQAVAEVGRLAEVMEQIGWEGEEARTLTADREILACAVDRALEYAKEYMSEVGPDDLDALMAQIKWLSETLDSFEPEKVGAA